MLDKCPQFKLRFYENDDEEVVEIEEIVNKDTELLKTKGLNTDDERDVLFKSVEELPDVFESKYLKDMLNKLDQVHQHNPNFRWSTYMSIVEKTSHHKFVEFNG